MDLKIHIVIVLCITHFVHNKTELGFFDRNIFCQSTHHGPVTLQITCPAQHVLIDVDLEGSHADCRGKTLSLITDANDCYWQNACVVKYPGDKIVSCSQEERCTCFLKITETANVRRAKCIWGKEISELSVVNEKRKKRNVLGLESATEPTRQQRSSSTQSNGEKESSEKRDDGNRRSSDGNNRRNESRVKRGDDTRSNSDRKKGRNNESRKADRGNLKDNGKKDRGNRQRNGKKKRRKVKCKTVKNTTHCRAKERMKNQGLIRSHGYFPWFYETSDITEYSLTMRKKGKHFMAVSVNLQGLCEEDYLTISSKGFRHSLNASHEVGVYNFTEKFQRSVKFTFKKTRTSRGCGGFIICYKVLGKTRTPDNDVCEELASDAELSLHIGKESYTEYCCSGDATERECYYNKSKEGIGACWSNCYDTNEKSVPSTEE